MTENNVATTATEFASLEKTLRKLDDMNWGRSSQSRENFCQTNATEEMSAAVHDKRNVTTTCCICDETYKDPMLLPCGHTFCLTCLQHIGNYTDKNLGDPMPCPLCRQEFTIPEDGFSALEKNLFMIKLVLITTARQEALSMCDKHENENMCLYCSECNEILCLVCLSDCHENHRMWNLKKAAEILCAQFQSNVATAKNCMSGALKKKERLLQKKSIVLENIQGFETEVYQVRWDLKALIDRHADSLLQNIESLKKKLIEDIEMEEKELDKHLECLRNFEIYCAELASNERRGSLFCKIASELNEEIVEMKQLNEIILQRQLRSFCIHFAKTEPAALDVYKTNNIIGVVEAYIDYSEKPELVTTMATETVCLANQRNDISGMAVSNKDIFVVHDLNPVISIYDSCTHKLRKEMTLKGLVRKVDPKHCVDVCGCICIVNGFTREIICIDQNQNLKKWSTDNDWGRLSVSTESTIVAVCFNTNVLREYSLQGTLLREIKLSQSMAHPLHAIKLRNGHFVVSHGSFKDAINRVCLINDSGAITKSFGGRSGSSIQQLDVPTCLAVDESGNILVLDRNNSRVLLLSPALEFKRVLLTRDNGLRRPVAMQLVENTNRLYIADNNWENHTRGDCKVLVFRVK